jgi:regulator of sirC expression with transglutaminase-like and TPR domain
MEDRDDPARLRPRAALRAELIELKQALQALLDALDAPPSEPEQSAVVTSVVTRRASARIPPR